MKYIRKSTLVALSSQEMRSIPRVPRSQLPQADLLVYDGGVSPFWFELEPVEDIERFLLHAHFGCRARGGLLACREDLHEMAASFLENPGIEPLKELVIPTDGALPSPLRFTPHQPALEAIQHEGRWRGQITCCSCGIACCFSQYAWIERGLCLFLFTISGASLKEVDFLPFRVAANTQG